MDFAQQRMQQQDAARQMMYQNPGYQFERRERKTLILDISDVHGTVLDCPLGNASEFSVELFEPLIIDKHSEIYLDSFLTHNSLVCHTGNTMAFSLQINEFNVNSNVASTASGQNTFNRIIIPNEHSSTDDVFSCVMHKGKKMNYVCSINPCKLSKITGKITDLGGNSMYSTSQLGTNSGHIINKVTLTSGAKGTVIAGETFGWDAGVSDTSINLFTVAFNMDEGATDLYFYDNGSTVTGSPLGSGLTTINSSSGSNPATNLDNLTADVSTFRQGDTSRFIAEFVIVARE